MKKIYQTTVSIEHDNLEIAQRGARLVVANKQKDLDAALKIANANLCELIAKDTPPAKGHTDYRFVNLKYSAEFQSGDKDSPVLVEGAYLCVTVEGEWLFGV